MGTEVAKTFATRPLLAEAKTRVRPLQHLLLGGWNMKPPRFHPGITYLFLSGLILSGLAWADPQPGEFTYARPAAGTSGTSGARPAEDRQPKQPDPYAELKKKLASDPGLLTNETSVGLSDLAGLAASLPKDDPARARYDTEILRRVRNQDSQYYKLNPSQQQQVLDDERRREEGVERKNRRQAPQIFVQQIAQPQNGQKEQPPQANGGSMGQYGNGASGATPPGTDPKTADKDGSSPKDDKPVTAAIGIHRGTEASVDFSGALPGASRRDTTEATSTPPPSPTPNGTETDSAHH